MINYVGNKKYMFIQEEVSVYEKSTFRQKGFYVYRVNTFENNVYIIIVVCSKIARNVLLGHFFFF